MRGDSQGVCDEMPEFGQHGLEVLRQPLEDKVVTISRAQGSLTFPANFMLVGAQNPCPCGYWGDPEHACTCSPTLISRYQKRLSGPLLDRIDIHVEVPRVPFQKLSDERRGEPSAAIRARGEAARARQTARFAVGAGLPAGSTTARDGAKPAPSAGLTTNADMGPTQVRDHCPVDETGRQLLGAATPALSPECGIDRDEWSSSWYDNRSTTLRKHGMIRPPPLFDCRGPT